MMPRRLLQTALRGKLASLKAARSGARTFADVAEARSAAAKRELAILAEAFQRYDGDASGALDRAEITEALEDLNIPGDEVFVDSLFTQLDKNKDGTVELREWLEHLPKGTRIQLAGGEYVEAKLALEGRLRAQLDALADHRPLAYEARLSALYAIDPMSALSEARTVRQGATSIEERLRRGVLKASASAPEL